MALSHFVKRKSHHPNEIVHLEGLHGYTPHVKHHQENGKIIRNRGRSCSGFVQLTTKVPCQMLSKLQCCWESQIPRWALANGAHLAQQSSRKCLQPKQRCTWVMIPMLGLRFQ